MTLDGTTRRDALKLLGAGAAVATAATGSASATGFFGRDDVLEFDSLAGNQGPFVGQAGAIRGIPAGGLPWVIDEGKAELEEDEIEIEVEGLVLDPDDDRVPEPVQGTNPVPGFKGVVSCLTFAENDAGDLERLTETVETDPVEVGEDGDAKIEGEIDLPEPCYAPIVFVTAGGPDLPTLWFAVGGSR